MKMLAVSCMVCLSALMASAVPVLYTPGNWDDSLADTAFAVSGVPYSTPGNSATMANPNDTTLRLVLPTGAAPAGRAYATGDNFTGDFSGLLGFGTEYLTVQFKMNSLDTPPTPSYGMALYFMGGGNVWNLNLTSPLTTGIQSFSVAFSSLGAGWYSDTGTDFLADLGSVSQFGFEVGGSTYGSNQRFDFTDVQFVYGVPEPETVWMILVVMASLMITFRTRIAEMALQAKNRFTA